MTTVPPTEPYEARQPGWQQGVNRFCENWIFAFIVAMAIRHFGVEAFRIPSASMEPAMYGDPAFTRSDYVVVDKIFQRFRGVKRWDVTVFQFPHPEIEVGGEAVTARNEEDKRRDHLLTNPLMYRNFVKRAVVLPGDTFFIANGDIHLKGPDGTFLAARKPADLQERLWQPIYRHGAQRVEPDWYVPWRAGTAAAVENLKADGLRLTLADGEAGAVVFDQPLNNLYIKPGLVEVTARDGSHGPQQVKVALLEPQFAYHGRTGNIWHLDQWWANRLNSADLDNRSSGTSLNDNMRERIGDVRVSFRVAALTGGATLRLREGARQWAELRLAGDGWTLVAATTGAAERELARGTGTVVGRTLTLATIDDQLVVTIDGAEAYRDAIAACDPQADPLEISWRGAGGLTLATLAIDRDLHYCNNGFLQPESLPHVSKKDGAIDIGAKATWYGKIKERDTPGAGRITAAKDLYHMRDTREQMLGRELRSSETWKRIGYSPETAITAPANGYLLLGDNSPFSWDARNWGWVPAENLRGRVLIRVRSRFLGDFPLPFTDWAVVK